MANSGSEMNTTGWLWSPKRSGCRETRQKKASSSNCQMSWKIEWVNRREWITFVMFADSWLPHPLCVSSNYTGTDGRGKEGDESAVKPGHEQSQKQREGANAWTPSHDRQPLGLFYSAARSFLGFVLSALPSHPPTRPPLWMVLQMICVQFCFTQANTASKSRHTLPPSLQSARLSRVGGLLNLFSPWVGCI